VFEGPTSETPFQAMGGAGGEGYGTDAGDGGGGGGGVIVVVCESFQGDGTTDITDYTEIAVDGGPSGAGTAGDDGHVFVFQR